MQIVQFTMDMYDSVYEMWEKTGLSLGISDTKDQIERALEYSKDLFIVGLVNNKIVAAVLGAYDGRRGYVHHLSVDPSVQKSGYGRMIMEELHKRFREKDVKKVHLFIEVDNEDVKNFYLKVGWHTREDLMMMSFVP